MDVRINIDKKFDKDTRRLSGVEMKTLKQKVNLLVDLVRGGLDTSAHLSKLYSYSFGMDLDSSLYVMKINKTLRLVLTSEEDPLFNEYILTLMRVVKLDDLDKVFKGIAESLNQQFLNKGGRKNG